MFIELAYRSRLCAACGMRRPRPHAKRDHHLSSMDHPNKNSRNPCSGNTILHPWCLCIGRKHTSGDEDTRESKQFCTKSEVDINFCFRIAGQRFLERGVGVSFSQTPVSSTSNYEGDLLLKDANMYPWSMQSLGSFLGMISSKLLTSLVQSMIKYSNFPVLEI